MYVCLDILAKVSPIFHLALLPSFFYAFFPCCDDSSQDVDVSSRVFTERMAAILRSLNSSINASFALVSISPTLTLVSLSTVRLYPVFRRVSGCSQLQRQPRFFTTSCGQNVCNQCGSTATSRMSYDECRAYTTPTVYIFCYGVRFILLHRSLKARLIALRTLYCPRGCLHIQLW